VNKSALIGIVGAFLCALAIWESARIGLARTAAIKALLSNGVSSAESSVRKVPSDAEVHAARGIVLQRTDDYAQACRELERAVQLRPRDYFLWMMLGVTRDLNDDQQGALTALRESVTLAPAYAKPRWLMGNLLLRMNQIDEAFRQLRGAAAADPALLPNVIDLAWGFAHNDAARTVGFIGPQTDAARLSLAIFLAGKKEGSAAMEQFARIRTPDRSGADQLTEKLMDGRFFGEAFAVWKMMRCDWCSAGSLVNPGFEEDIAIPAQGFGWRIMNASSNVTLSIDTSEHAEGARSVRLDFHGESEAASPLVSQFVLVSPYEHYRLSFAALSRSFVSAAAPTVRVIDASSSEGSVLGQSSNLSDAVAWRGLAVDFTATEKTHAIQVILTRPGCPATTCAAYGTVWLDAFKLEVIAAAGGK
jgi:hypothetical protein